LFSIVYFGLPVPLDTQLDLIHANAKSSMNWTFGGISIDLSDDWANTPDSNRINREFDSNVIDESDLQ
jgi:hypothetical protein